MGSIREWSDKRRAALGVGIFLCLWGTAMGSWHLFLLGMAVIAATLLAGVSTEKLRLRMPQLGLLEGECADPDDRLDSWRRGAFAAGIVLILTATVSDWSWFLPAGLGLLVGASSFVRRRSPGTAPEDRRESTEGHSPSSPNTNDFEVVMLSPGPRAGEVKYALISLLRAAEPEVAMLLITRPAVIKRGVSGREADRLKTALERLGATVDIVRAPSAHTMTQVIPKPELVVPRPAPAQAQSSPRRDPIIVPMSALFDLVLVSPGAKKIEVRKALKQHLDLDLLEAYNAVEHTPSVLKHGTTRADAEWLREAIEPSGAKLEVRPASE